MEITKLEDETKQGFCKILWRKLRLRGILLLALIQFFRLGGERGWGGGGRVFEVGANSRLGAYSNKYGSYCSRFSLFVFY